MLRVVLLGSTGSIGRSTLDVISQHRGQFEVIALTAGSNADLLVEQARQFRPQVVGIGEPSLAESVRKRLHQGVEVVVGDEGLTTCATLSDADTVVVAVVGARGLRPTFAAAAAGKRVCLANKEALAAGGALVTEAIRRSGGEMLPIDSEHSAVFQCLQASNGEFARLYLTASGGPFRNTPASELEMVTPAAALRHPTWRMGAKITIDSATLMNKGLEVIEAHWLFNADWDDIKVVVHPQSVIHSMVELNDGSILAQLGVPDMRLPIQIALLHPRRLPSPAERLDPRKMGTLSFEEPDVKRFPSLELAYTAGRIGGTMPAVLNAANEVAVDLFLAGRLSFTGIARLVERCMEAHRVWDPQSVEDILAADTEARQRAAQMTATSLRP